ncbi:MAG TPA: maltose alpha-D-glucosyltransferase [Opitutaceae bacterium]|nr:maltose alpha-D-glucosyltransferase [Opitutaceae bacterium]
MSTTPSFQTDKDPLWYKKGVIYQAHVRAFYDSDGNGIGDFQGLTQKLDYLQDLGVSTVWLLPFYPSPLKDDGYDIADYYSVNPIYGTLDDFKEFLDQAHKRSLRVITELVINHTSDQHPWFQKSRRSKPGTPWRDFYVWSDTPEKYKDARIIFRDFELSNWTLDPVANAYYWHRFYSHQPDLNFDNPLVHQEVLKVLEFWLDLGVDGLRLDAVPYLYEREGTNCENLEETHAYLKALRRHVDQKYGDRMLLAEANQWPEDAVQYLGDECHMAFHFPLMPRLFMSVRMEDRAPIIDILEQTPAIPEKNQWAIFLRNHDELTLEMVTEEERDYMYRMYASDTRARINLGIRRRLAPLLNNDRRRIELLNALLLSMPGTPVIYYGDEIGMGDNIYLGDRNGVRTPMHWSSDKNAGFSRANPQSLYLPIILDPEYHYEAVNVEAQQRNLSSLLWWMKRILALRQRWKALGQGNIRFLQPDNRKVLTFIREFEDERILVVANLSRYAQPFELDLSEMKGLVPLEIFGSTRFPAITAEPYKLTINPHAFFWFSIEPAEEHLRAATLPQTLAELATIDASNNWETLFTDLARSRLRTQLPEYLQPRRWFGGKAKELSGVSLLDAVPLQTAEGKAYITLLNVEYAQGDPEVYVVPIGYREATQAETFLREYPQAVIARVPDDRGPEGLLIDAMASKPFAQALLQTIEKAQHLRGQHGEIVGIPTQAFDVIRRDMTPLEPSISKAEQSNTALIFGDRFIFKLFRRPEAGINPDVEIGRFLTAKSFANVPPLGGSLEYRTRTGENRSIGILSGFVPNAKDTWEYTLDALGRYYERVLLYLAEQRPCPISPKSLLDLVDEEPSKQVVEAVGTYLESARLLGVRTAEMHLALGSGDDIDFAPEPFSPHYQRSLYQSMRNLVMENLELLKKRLKTLPSSVQRDAETILGLQNLLLSRYRAVYEQRIDAQRIRCHGDYHLGQLLYTGKDFVILDFEGEPARALSARRLKRSPISDVAGMLRSFHYAAYSAMDKLFARGLINEENRAKVTVWTAFWYQWVSATFVRAYLNTIGASNLLPRTRTQLRVLFDAYLLDKAVYEIGYELNNRPTWLRIPFDGILQLTQSHLGTEVPPRSSDSASPIEAPTARV